MLISFKIIPKFKIFEFDIHNYCVLFSDNRIDQNINNHYSYSQIGMTPEKIIEFFENTETDVVILPLYDAPSSQSAHRF